MNRKRQKAFSLLVFGPALILVLAWAQGRGTVPEPVQKILSHNCTVAGCHQGKYPPMNISFETGRVLPSTLNITSNEKPGLKIIDTAEPGKSYLLMKIRGDSDIMGKRMPLNGTPLVEADIRAIQDWILSLKGASPEAPNR